MLYAAPHAQAAAQAAAPLRDNLDMLFSMVSVEYMLQAVLEGALEASARPAALELLPLLSPAAFFRPPPLWPPRGAVAAEAAAAARADGAVVAPALPQAKSQLSFEQLLTLAARVIEIRGAPPAPPPPGTAAPPQLQPPPLTPAFLLCVLEGSAYVRMDQAASVMMAMGSALTEAHAARSRRAVAAAAAELLVNAPARMVDLVCGDGAPGRGVAAALQLVEDVAAASPGGLRQMAVSLGLGWMAEGGPVAMDAVAAAVAAQRRTWLDAAMKMLMMLSSWPGWMVRTGREGVDGKGCVVLRRCVWRGGGHSGRLLFQPSG